jgi:hypothetical protein
MFPSSCVHLIDESFIQGGQAELKEWYYIQPDE